MPPSTRSPLNRRAAATALATVTLGVLAGCGSSSSHTTSPAAATAPASTPAPHATLSILTPRAGEQTGSTVTVRVRLDGAPAGIVDAFRYLLDGHLTRHAGSAATFHEVAPGRHRIEVLLATDGTVHAETSFAVRAPAPAPAKPAPERAITTEQHRPEPAPEAKKEAAPKEAAPKAAEPKEAAPSTGGIPQNNGGDGDSDNNGGPSDGDGNV